MATTYAAFTPIVPNITAGSLITLQIVDDVNGDDDTYYNLVPVSGTTQVLLIITNSDAGAEHTVTLTSQPDNYGISGDAIDQVVTVTRAKTFIAGPFLRRRWGDPADAYRCTVTYEEGEETHLSIAVVDVPWSSM